MSCTWSRCKACGRPEYNSKLLERGRKCTRGSLVKLFAKKQQRQAGGTEGGQEAVLPLAGKLSAEAIRDLLRKEGAAVAGDPALQAVLAAATAAA